MLKVLTDRAGVARAAKTLRITFERGEPVRTIPGHQGGSEPMTVYWHDAAKVWAVQLPGAGRYWQAFGSKRPPVDEKCSIVSEINPPLAGINRQTAGVFLTRGGVIFLGHRGNRINQISKEDFRKHFQTGPAGQWQIVSDGSDEREVVVLGRIDRPAIMNAIGEFVREVRRIKKLVRPNLKSAG
jgi:hypothetical protein